MLSSRARPRSRATSQGRRSRTVCAFSRNDGHCRSVSARVKSDADVARIQLCCQPDNAFAQRHLRRAIVPDEPSAQARTHCSANALSASYVRLERALEVAQNTVAIKRPARAMLPRARVGVISPGARPPSLQHRCSSPINAAEIELAARDERGGPMPARIEGQAEPPRHKGRRPFLWCPVRALSSAIARK